MAIFGWLPGADVNSIVDRELANGDLNATRTGFADRTGSWNWQDSFGAWLAGTNKDEILKLATAKANENLRTKLGPEIARATANLGPLKGEYQGVEGQTTETLLQQLANDEARGKALSTVQAQSDVDVSTISPTADVGAILGAGRKANQATEKAERERQEGRELTLLERQEVREDRRDARQEKRLAQDRLLSAQTNQMNMQLEYARLAQADRQRAADRKDKALMMLIQGLGNLGGAFTI